MTFLERNASEPDRRTSPREDVETLAGKVRALQWRVRVLTLVLVSVFAGSLLAGGAWAASQYVITSTTQIKPSVLAKIEKSARLAAKGSRGDAGPIGATGPAGAPGPAGLPGSQGSGGAPGAIGATGVAGAIGATGVAGATGATGVAGPDLLAEGLALIAQADAERFGIISGSYSTLTPAQLVTLDGTIRIAVGAGNAWISAASGTVTTFAVTATSPTSDTYTITRNANGTVSHTCANAFSQTACVNGTW